MPNTQLFERLVDLIAKLNNFTSGEAGFDIVTGTTNNDKLYFAVKAMNGDVTFGGGNTVRSRGDAPESGDVLPQGDVLYGNFDDLDVSSGKLYAYYDLEISNN